MENYLFLNYVKFVAENLPKTLSIPLNNVKEIDGVPTRVITKLGIHLNKKVSLEILEVYTRSIKVRLTWEDQDSEIHFFTPTSKSLNSAWETFYDKCSTAVNDSYTDEELLKLNREHEEKFNNSLKRALHAAKLAKIKRDSK